MTAQPNRDIAAFLEARIVEDEEVASNRHETYCGWCLHEGPGFDDDGCQCNYPARVLAECEAKRRIVELHDYEWMGPDDAAGKGCEHDYEEWPCSTLRHLAAVYADQPDYLEEWRP